MRETRARLPAPLPAPSPSHRPHTRDTDQEAAALAARWWKWALSAPDNRSPVLDETGEHAGWKQPADLWFLAGTYGGASHDGANCPRGGGSSSRY